MLINLVAHYCNKFSDEVYVLFRGAAIYKNRGINWIFFSKIMYQGPYESTGLITIITVISCMRRWVCLTNGNIYIQKQGNPLEIVLRKNDVSSVLIKWLIILESYAANFILTYELNIIVLLLLFLNSNCKQIPTQAIICSPQQYLSGVVWSVTHQGTRYCFAC